MPQIEFTKPNPPTFKVIDQAKLYLIFLGEWTYPAADDIVTSLNKILGSTYLDDFATDYKVKKPDYLGKTFDRSPLSADEPRRRQIEEIVKHNLLPATKKPAQGELLYIVIGKDGSGDDGYHEVMTDYPEAGNETYYAWVSQAQSNDLAVLTHEIVEAISDPKPGRKPSPSELPDGREASGYTFRNQELCDLCFPVRWGAAGGPVAIDAEGIVVSRYYSNTRQGCVP